MTKAPLSYSDSESIIWNIGKSAGFHEGYRQAMIDFKIEGGTEIKNEFLSMPHIPADFSQR
jgi:hypothetical protein